MITRYQAPFAANVFSDNARMERWTTITKWYAQTYLNDKQALLTELALQPVPPVSRVNQLEHTTGHDVVAFLAIFTKHMSDDLKPYIHRGLTSSDIVDNAHFATLHEHAVELGGLVHELHSILARWAKKNTPRAGRTHGQLAVPTTWQHQIRVHRDVLGNILRDLETHVLVCPIKSPGPVGNSPELWGRAKKISNRTSVGVVVNSTQIIPRDYQLAWACLYLRLATACENLAMLVRTGSRHEIREVREGQAADRVGSSAMPHKSNPITSEKITGLARVARGHFLAIAESVTTWDDRDLSNSAVERTAVPDLAHVTEYMVSATSTLMEQLVINDDRMYNNVIDPRLYTNAMQTVLQTVVGMGPIEAAAEVRDITTSSHEPGAWFSQLYAKIRKDHGEIVARAMNEEFYARRTMLAGQ